MVSIPYLQTRGWYMALVFPRHLHCALRPPRVAPFGQNDGGGAQSTALQFDAALAEAAPEADCRWLYMVSKWIIYG